MKKDFLNTESLSSWSFTEKSFNRLLKKTSLRAILSEAIFENQGIASAKNASQ